MKKIISCYYEDDSPKLALPKIQKNIVFNLLIYSIYKQTLKIISKKKFRLIKHSKNILRKCNCVKITI